MTEHAARPDAEQDRQARIDLIKTYWDALMSADLVTFRSLLAPDAVIHYPGQNYLSGDYTTTDEIVELYRQLCQFIQDGVFVGEVLDITTGDEYTTVILKYDLHLPVTTLHGRATGLFLLDDQYRIKEYWLHEWNQVMMNRMLRATHLSKPFMGPDQVGQPVQEEGEVTASLPPGKLGAPWIGETLGIARNNHKFYKDHFAKYGPIFKTRLFGFNFVIVSGHEAFHQFATDPRVERGGTDPVSVEQMFHGSLALIDGNEHHARKDVMLHAVRTDEAMAAYLERMQRIWGAHVDRWARGRQRHPAPRPPARLGRAHRRALHRRRVEGAHRRAQPDPGGDALLAADPAAADPRARRTPRPSRAASASTSSSPKRSSGTRSTRSGTTTSCRACWPSAPDHGVSAETLLGDVRHLIFAGQAGFFVPFILLTMTLGQHPEMREKARAEVRAVSPDGQVTMEQLPRMEYLGQLPRRCGASSR